MIENNVCHKKNKKNKLCLFSQLNIADLTAILGFSVT